MVHVRSGAATLEGDLHIPSSASGVVLFAHGSGSSRRSERNRFVADLLRGAGLATLLLDLLTRDEEAVDQWTLTYRFDIDLLADRLTGAADWLLDEPSTSALPIGLFGASTGAAAALHTAARRPDAVRAVVSRGGRPDLAAPILPKVRAPTLLIVGGNDLDVMVMNRSAMAGLRAEKELRIVPGASHLFEEPGALEQVAELARDWFATHLNRPES